MYTRKRLTMALPALAIALLAVMVSFTACDNRNPINTSRTAGSKVNNISLYFDPRDVVLHKLDAIYSVTIGIMITDDQGRGMDSLQNSITMRVTPNAGILSRIDTTDVPGLYSTQYLTSPGATGSVTFNITVGGKTASDSIFIVYQPVGVPSEISMNFNPQPLVVRSPYKSDTATIDIWVRDENGAGLDSIAVVVNRSPAYGTIVQGEPTQQGYTRALYITDPGNQRNIRISAAAGSATIADTLRVIQRYGGKIAYIYIVSQKQSLVAGGNDSMQIYATVIDTTNTPISDNTTIFLSTSGRTPHHGQITPTSAPTLGGVATFVLTSPATLDSALVIEVDTLKAWGIDISGETTYAYSPVSYIPGQPANLAIITIPMPMVAGSGTNQQIPCRVQDANGNSVADGTQVRFKKLMALSNITGLATTIHGIGTAVYTVGTQSGTDYVQAFIPRPSSNDTLWSGTVQLVIRSSRASNITIRAANPTIQIGGIATQIIATLRDENGNALSDGYAVQFQITAAPPIPRGPSFNFVPTPESTLWDVTDSTDVNGQASVALFSGTKAGTVRIKATALDNVNVFKEKTVVVIASGPPARIDISPVANVHPEGEVLVGGVTAMVYDSFTNPVEYNTAVHFEVIPDSIAMIGGDAYTGGYVFNPDSGTVDTFGVPGLAFTQITYPCNRTFSKIKVVAFSGSMADTSDLILLAMYSTNARCACNADPASIFIPTLLGWDTSDVSCQLIDGIGCPIGNGIILFSAQGAGELCGPTRDTTNSGGWAYTKFRIQGQMIPESPPDPPQITAKVVAVLEGYPTVKGEATIDCRRPAM